MLIRRIGAGALVTAALALATAASAYDITYVSVNNTGTPQAGQRLVLGPAQTLVPGTQTSNVLNDIVNASGNSLSITLNYRENTALPAGAQNVIIRARIVQSKMLQKGFYWLGATGTSLSCVS